MSGTQRLQEMEFELALTGNLEEIYGLGVRADAVSFAPGRDLHAILQAARSAAPTILAVDSIQTVRDLEATTQPGGVAQ